MRATVLYLVALAALAGCGDTQDASGSETTSGDEIIARRVVGSTTAALTQNSLEIYVIDVGQGDSTLIVGPLVDGHRFTMLIDAGRGRSDDVIEDAITNTAEITTPLDVVVATHYDYDHIGGFTSRGSSGTGSLLWDADYQDGELQGCTPRSEFFPTVAIVDHGPGERESDAEEEWTDCASVLAGTTPDQPKYIQVAGGIGLDTEFDLGGGYKAEVVAGGGYVRGKQEQVDDADTKNEMSVAVLVSSQEGFHFLVTGDLIGQKLPDKIDPDTGDSTPRVTDEDALLEGELGKSLEAEGVDLEVLRTGHHGAGNTTEASFIAATQPEVAIISVGNTSNPYGHPHNRTHRTLDENDVPLILQTNEGKPKSEDGPLHEFEECGNDPECTQTVLFVAGGTIHIVVDGDTYRIDVVEPTYHDDVEPISVDLDCDELGCEGEVE